MSIVKNWNGSWGTPDLGITEWLTSSRTGQGGSDIIPNTPKPGQPTNDPTLNSIFSNPSYGDVKGASSINVSNQGFIGPQKPIGPTQPTNQQQQQSPGGGTGGEPDFQAGNRTYSSMDDYNAAMSEANRYGFANPDQMQAYIDQVYGSAYGTLNQARNDLNTGFNEDVSLLGQNVQRQKDQAAQEEQNYMQDYGTKQNAFNKNIESGLEQAVRAFNALQQKARARFGLGTGAGQAFGELANQEFLRQQGNLLDQKATGALEFQKEMDRAKQFVAQKVSDLDFYRLQAENELKKNLRAGLLAIDQQRGTLDSSKAMDKLNIIRDAQSQLMQLSQADKQYRRELAMGTLNNLQSVAGRAFTPKEIQAVLSDFGAGFSSLAYGQQAPQYDGMINTLSGNKDDELKSLMI